MTCHPETPANPAPAVDLEDVRFAWPGQKEDTVRIPRFVLPRQGKAFVAGPSGSGKSTLLSLISGILRPSSGEVRIDGTSLGRLTGSARDLFRGSSIGYIFQQFNLIPYLSVLDNVLIPCRLSPRRRERAAGLHGSPVRAAEHVLERLGLGPDLWQRQVIRLSVGQQQRVAAARALIGNPPLIIADEPTSALDRGHTFDFLELLLGECDRAGSSLLFVSHDESLARLFPAMVRMADLNVCARPS